MNDRIEILAEVTTTCEEDGQKIDVLNLVRGAISCESIEGITVDPEQEGYVRVYIRTGGYWLVKTDFNMLVEKIWGQRYGIDSWVMNPVRSSEQISL